MCALPDCGEGDIVIARITDDQGNVNEIRDSDVESLMGIDEHGQPENGQDRDDFVGKEASAALEGAIL